MKRKVLTIAVAALMVAAIAGASSAASEINWRVFLVADDGAGGGSGATMHIGVYPTSLDGLDTATPLQDTPTPFGVDLPGTTRWATGLIDGDSTNVYTHQIQSPYTPPQNHKTWDLRVMANVNANALPIRLQFKSSTANPSPTVGGKPIFFELVMINNRGVVGAPANGTAWSVPVPTGANGSVFWSMDTAQDTTGHVWGNLPLIKSASALDPDTMRTQGYEMQFRVVPEPSGLLALGACLVGLAGFLRRRR